MSGCKKLDRVPRFCFLLVLWLQHWLWCPQAHKQSQVAGVSCFSNCHILNTDLACLIIKGVLTSNTAANSLSLPNLQAGSSPSYLYYRFARQRTWYVQVQKTTASHHLVGGIAWPPEPGLWYAKVWSHFKASVSQVLVPRSLERILVIRISKDRNSTKQTCGSRTLAMPIFKGQICTVPSPKVGCQAPSSILVQLQILAPACALKHSFCFQYFLKRGHIFPQEPHGRQWSPNLLG